MQTVTDDLANIFLMVLMPLQIGAIATVVDIITILWTAIGIITACCLVPSSRTRWGSRILADIKKNHEGAVGWSAGRFKADF